MRLPVRSARTLIIGLKNCRWLAGAFFVRYQCRSAARARRLLNLRVRSLPYQNRYIYVSTCSSFLRCASPKTFSCRDVRAIWRGTRKVFDSFQIGRNYLRACTREREERACDVLMMVS